MMADKGRLEKKWRADWSSGEIEREEKERETPFDEQGRKGDWFNVTVINETGKGYFSQNRKGVRDQLTPNITLTVTSRKKNQKPIERGRERLCVVTTTLDLTPGGGGELLRWRRLVSSKPSPVPDGEASPSPPPLHERGVVGLHLVEE